MWKFLQDVAALFVGVFIPSVLCMWAILGTDGIRTYRRLVKQSKELVCEHGIVLTGWCDECGKAEYTMSNTQKEERGKWPIDRPCSACSAGDTKMEYHDHGLPKREEDLPTVLDHKFVANECHEHGCHFLFLQNGSNCARCNADLAHPCAGSGEAPEDHSCNDPSHYHNFTCRNSGDCQNPRLYWKEKSESLARELSQARERVEDLERQIKQWETWGVIEIAVRNPNVASYMEHWEKRAEAAESSLNNLLAIIHRDGGHHTAAVGIERSVEDAHKVWAEMMRRMDEAESSLAALKGQNGWVSVKERLPGVGEWCWVVCDGVVQRQAACLLGKGFACLDGFEWNWADESADTCPLEEVTNWQPLPSAPPEDKAEQEGE